MSLYNILDQTKPFPSIKVQNISCTSLLESETLNLTGTNQVLPGTGGTGTLNIQNGSIFAGKNIVANGNIYANNFKGVTGAFLSDPLYKFNNVDIIGAPTYNYYTSNGVTVLNIHNFQGIVSAGTGLLTLNLASTIPEPDAFYNITTNIYSNNISYVSRAVLHPDGLITIYHNYVNTYTFLNIVTYFNGMTFTYKSL